MNEEDSRLISAITSIREKNNKAWMSILRLALEHAPKETRKLIQSITENDKMISQLTAKLGGAQ